MIAINIDSDNRILRATREEFKDSESILVEALPEGDITEYKYIDGEYIHEPLPQPEEAPEEASIEERMAQNEADIAFIAMMADIEL